MSATRKLLEPDHKVWQEAFSKEKNLDFDRLLKLIKVFHKDQLEEVKKDTTLLAAGDARGIDLQRLKVDVGVTLHVFECLLADLLLTVGAGQGALRQSEAYTLVDIKGRLAASHSVFLDLFRKVASSSGTTSAPSSRFEVLLSSINEVQNDLVKALSTYTPMTDFAPILDYCRKLLSNPKYEGLKGSSLKFLAEELS